ALHRNVPSHPTRRSSDLDGGRSHRRNDRRRRVIGDGDRNGRRRRRVRGRIAGDGGERVTGIAGRRRIPRDRIGRRQIFGAEVGAIQLELDADDAHVIARRGGDGDRRGDRGVRGRRGDG